MKSKNKCVLVLLVFIALGQIPGSYQALGQESYRPVSKPVPLFELLASIGRGDHWTRVAIVTGGKVRLIDHKELRSNVPLLIPGETDLVALDEAADELLAWTSSHPSESIPLSILRGLPSGSLFRADGSPANPATGGNTKRNNTERVREKPATPTPIGVQPTMPPEVDPAATPKSSKSHPEPASASKETPTSTQWPAWAAILVVAVGLLWLVIKNRKEP